MILRLFQQSLEDIYGLGVLPVIEHYLLEREMLKHLGQNDSVDAPRVLVKFDHHEVQMGVYFNERLMEVIHAGASAQDLSLNVFCEIAEEVSHFTYLAWSAQNAQARSLLDLETQAELDKWLLAHLHREATPTLKSLFSHYRLREHLSDEERQRYHEANHLAQTFVEHHLERTDEGLSRQVPLLRHFYRQPSPRRTRQLRHLAHKRRSRGK